MRYLIIALLCLTSGCSLFSRREDDSGPRSDDSAIQEQAATSEPAPELAVSNVPPVGSAENNVVDVSEALSPMANAVTAGTAKEKLSGVAPSVGIRYLKNGNVRFVKGYVRKDGQSKADIQKASGAQKPHSIIYGTSDSRMPPEVIFDQKLGEIFVVRTVDMAYDASVEASLNYGVEQLGIRNIVILGYDEAPGNVTALASQILKRSGWLSARVQSGDVKITPATYDLKTGLVTFQ